MLLYLQPTWQADVPESAVTHKVVAVCHIAALHHRHHHSQHFLQSRTSDLRRVKKRIKQVQRPHSWKVSYGDVFTASPFVFWRVVTVPIQSSRAGLAGWFTIYRLCSTNTVYSHLSSRPVLFSCDVEFPLFRFRFRDSEEHLLTECPVLLWKHLICFQQVVDGRRMAAGPNEPAMGELGLDHGGLEAVRGSELNVSVWEQGHRMLQVSVDWTIERNLKPFQTMLPRWNRM